MGEDIESVIAKLLQDANYSVEKAQQGKRAACSGTLSPAPVELSILLRSDWLVEESAALINLWVGLGWVELRRNIVCFLYLTFCTISESFGHFPPGAFSPK